MADTKLLLHFDGADQSQVVTDSSLSEHVITCVGTAQLDTAQKVFGSASGLLDGNSDYFTIPNHADWAFGTGNFTVDFRVRFNSVNQYSVFYGYDYITGFAIMFHHVNNTIDVWQNSVRLGRFAFNPVINTWYHIAVVRSGNDLMVFLNGTQIGITEDVTGLNVTDAGEELWIGRDNIGNNYFHNGWLEEFRVSKGVARWTSNFTPPTAEYPEGYKDLAGSSGAQSALSGNLTGVESLAGLVEAQAALSGNLVEVITITVAATASTTIDPYFEFPSGTIEAKVNSVSVGFFTSGVAKEIIVVDGDTIECICSDWNAITVIDFWNSAVGGSVADWILPSSLAELYLMNTSLSGDISGWPDLGLLNTLEIYNTSIDYDSSAGSFEDAGNGLAIEFYSCLLTETQVDNVLLDLVTSAATNGILGIDGNNAAPSASGLISKATLVSRGWTVGTTTAIFSLAGLIAGLSVATGLLNVTRALAGSVAAQSSLTSYLRIYYIKIPPFMHRDLIDPYSGGAWLWLIEIAVPGYETQRLARNTEDIRHAGQDWKKWNIDPGKQTFVGDGSIPRTVLRVAQDPDGVIEDIINASKGCHGGTIKLIRVNEKWLDYEVSALEINYSILVAESDIDWAYFTMGIPSPFNQMVPLRLGSSKICPWAIPEHFKGVRCQYAGPDTTCTGTIEACRDKDNTIHWAGELGLDPSVARI